MAATMTRTKKFTRMPYPKMPSNWYSLYVRRSTVQVSASEAERIARNVVAAPFAARLSAEHKEVLYLYVREATAGDWSALVALADILTEADDFDPADRTHPATIALNTAASALERHLAEHDQYCKDRRRFRSSGGDPLRVYGDARHAAFGDDTALREAAMAFIADRMRHGECE